MCAIPRGDRNRLGPGDRLSRVQKGRSRVAAAEGLAVARVLRSIAQSCFGLGVFLVPGKTPGLFFFPTFLTSLGNFSYPKWDVH